MIIGQNYSAMIDIMEHREDLTEMVAAAIATPDEKMAGSDHAIEVRKNIKKALSQWLAYVMGMLNEVEARLKEITTEYYLIGAQAINDASQEKLAKAGMSAGMSAADELDNISNGSCDELDSVRHITACMQAFEAAKPSEFHAITAKIGTVIRMNMTILTVCSVLGSDLPDEIEVGDEPDDMTFAVPTIKSGITRNPRTQQEEPCWSIKVSHDDTPAELLKAGAGLIRNQFMCSQLAREKYAMLSAATDPRPDGYRTFVVKTRQAAKDLRTLVMYGRMVRSAQQTMEHTWKE